MLMCTNVFGNLHSWWPHNFSFIHSDDFLYSKVQIYLFFKLAVAKYGSRNWGCKTWETESAPLVWDVRWGKVQDRVKKLWLLTPLSGESFFFLFFLNSSDHRSSSCLESSPADVLSAILRQITACLKFIRPKCSVNISTEKIVRFQMEGTKELPLFGHSCINVPLQTRLTFPVLSQRSSTAPLIHQKIITIQSLSKARSRKKSVSSNSWKIFNIQRKYLHLFTAFTEVLQSYIKTSLSRQTVSKKLTWPIQDVKVANQDSERITQGEREDVVAHTWGDRGRSHRGPSVIQFQTEAAVQISGGGAPQGGWKHTQTLLIMSQVVRTKLCGKFDETIMRCNCFSLTWRDSLLGNCV